MIEKKKVGALLLMGGSGMRLGDRVPKQFHLLGEKKVYLRTLEIFLNSHLFDAIVLSCHPEWMDEVRLEVPSWVQVVEGGSTRQESSFLGLQSFAEKPDIVVIHDAVRPFVTEAILKANIEMAFSHGAVDTCISSSDTLVYAPGNKTIHQIPNRKDFLRGQTPQTFRYDWILHAHEMALREEKQDVSDDCRLVLEAGYPVHVVSGAENNLKITTMQDLEIARYVHECQKHLRYDFNEKCC